MVSHKDGRPPWNNILRWQSRLVAAGGPTDGKMSCLLLPKSLDSLLLLTSEVLQPEPKQPVQPPA